MRVQRERENRGRWERGRVPDVGCRRGSCAVGSAVTRPNKDWEQAGKVQLGARRCQAGGWPGPFVPLALSYVCSDTC